MTTEIVITGSGPHLGQLAQMADKISPNRMVWVGDSGVPVEWAAAIGGMQISSAAAIPSNAIVIGGRTDADGKFSFPPYENVFYIPSSAHRIHHPVVFSNWLQLDLSDRFVTCGYPGSGNGIVQAMLEYVLATIPAKENVGDVTHLVGAYGADYWQRVSTLLVQFGTRISPSTYGTGTYRESTASVVWSHGHSRSTLLGVPIRNYLWERVHKTHESFGRKMQVMGAAGAKCILTVRNPLDTIVSVAAKAAHVGVDLLGNEWLFRLVAKGIIQYYRSFLPAINDHQISAIRYEDCQASFEQVADVLVSACGAELTAAQIAAMKEGLLNKSISTKGHLFKPDQADKWRRYLGRWHIEILAEAGLGEILDCHGYPTSCFNAGADRPETLSIHPSISGVGDVAGLLVHCLEDSPDRLDHICRLGLVQGRVGDGMAFISNDPGAPGKFESFVRETGFMRLIQSGAT